MKNPQGVQRYLISSIMENPTERRGEVMGCVWDSKRAELWNLNENIIISQIGTRDRDSYRVIIAMSSLMFFSLHYTEMDGGGLVERRAHA